MNIDDLPKLKEEIERGLKELADARAEIKAAHEHTMRIGLALSEILEHLEKQGPTTAKAIADALSGVMSKLTVNMEAPKWTPPAINVPAAQVVVQPAAADDIEIRDIQTDNFGNLTSMKLVRVPATRRK
jgi:DNA repair ATPase RecN